MRHVAIIIPTYYGLDSACRKGVDSLTARGAQLLTIEGCSNVTLARNVALTKALTAPPSVTVFLLLDDDIGFHHTAADCLTKAAEHERRLVSGIYMLAKDRPSFSKMDGCGLVSGLGFAAIPRKLLQAKADLLPDFQSRNGDCFKPFCQSREESGRWYTEDTWFCKEFGGVLLCPIGVTHYKQEPLSVPADLLDFVRTQPGVCKVYT